MAEIIIAVLKNEDWLSRGVKNVNRHPTPVPYEIDLQNERELLWNKRLGRVLTLWKRRRFGSSSLYVCLFRRGACWCHVAEASGH